jgi:hypothetical protein
MPDEPKSRSAALSRRSVVQSTAGAVGALTLVGMRPKPAAGMMKISQKAVAYQDHPQGKKRCDECVQFQPPNACKIVDGIISPQGFCGIFMPRGQAAGQSAAILLGEAQPAAQHRCESAGLAEG